MPQYEALIIDTFSSVKRIMQGRTVVNTIKFEAFKTKWTQSIVFRHPDIGVAPITAIPFPAFLIVFPDMSRTVGDEKKNAILGEIGRIGLGEHGISGLRQVPDAPPFLCWNQMEQVRGFPIFDLANVCMYVCCTCYFFCLIANETKLLA